MSEEALRVLLIVLGVAAVALTPWIARRATAGAASRAELDLSGLDARVLFFSDAACRRCDRVRDLLERLTVLFDEVRYDADPDAHRRAGVDAVPLVVVRDESGVVTVQLAGVPSARRLRQAVGG